MIDKEVRKIKFYIKSKTSFSVASSFEKYIMRNHINT